MRPNLILHCGAPGTGAQRLQLALSEARTRLEEKGIYTPPAKGVFRGELRVLIGEASRSDNFGQAFLFKTDAALARITADERIKTIVLVQDSALGRPISSRRSIFYEQADETAERLRMALEDCDVQIRFVIRNFADLLPDYYIQQIQSGSKQTFQQFIETIDFDSLTWETPVTALKRHFGQENVQVFEYQDPGKDLAAALLRVFPELTAVLEGQVPHVASAVPMSKRMALVFRTFNRVLDKLSLPSNLRGQLFYMTREKVLYPLQSRSKSPGFETPPDLVDMLNSKYQLDLAALQPHPAFDPPRADDDAGELSI